LTGDLDCIFSPRSVAVIGASRDKGSIGWQLLDNLIRYDFQGMIFPVNPKAEVIHSMMCYPSVLDVPGDVDMAVVVVPKQFVAGVLEECGRKGVKGAVIISAGFKETGGEGVQMEQEVVAIGKKYGMRIVGPNCMGVLNSSPGVKMDATFAPTLPRAGKIGFVSQSGGLGIAILELAEELSMGVSKFMSIGNKADVSLNDMLEYLEDDPDTEVILLYVESFGNPRRFTQIARRVTRKKPVIAVKAGRTLAGARAASSHTGALAGADVAVDALFEECGIIRAASVEELYDFAMAFTYTRPPCGKRVAIVSNGGGPAIVTTDACVSVGLEMAELSPGTVEELRANLPREASVRNPIDMIASATKDSYGMAVRTLLKDPNVDGLITIFIPPIASDPLEVACVIAEASAGQDKPVLGVYMGREDVLEKVLEAEGNTLPGYLFPESAARALKAMWTYESRRRRGESQIREFPVDAGMVARALSRGPPGSFLPLDACLDLMKGYGFELPKYGLAKTVEEAKRIASDIGYPVALKLVARKAVHKSDVGGVALRLKDEAEVAEAFAGMSQRFNEAFPGAEMDGVLVMEMVNPGREVILGMTTDPQFGPLIMFGLGGIFVEVLKDVSFWVAPVTEWDARQMIRRIRSYPVLEGVRGQEGVDQEALVECIQRLSQMALKHPEIAEIDVNPLAMYPEGRTPLVLDARVRLRG